MAKHRIIATTLIADGKARLVEAPDLRFDQGDWPIEFDVESEHADEWFAQFRHVCSQRKWSGGGTTELDSTENSGTWIVREREGGQPPVAIMIWERGRDALLKIKVRPGPALGMDGVNELLQGVNERVRERYRETHHHFGYLEYFGKPWRGEIWFGESLRLGPPANSWEEAIHGPRVIVVDADVCGIGRSHAATEFERQMCELAVFLALFLRNDFDRRPPVQMWSWKTTVDGDTECEVRQHGYFENRDSNEMPKPGAEEPIELVAVRRPRLDDDYLHADSNQIVLPDDIHVYWQAFQQLASEPRRQFLEAGKTYQLAQRIWTDFQSASFALAVVACEALKPRERAHKKRRGRNPGLFEIIEALLGPESAEKLRGQTMNPQRLRDKHLHLGELFSGELDPSIFTTTFHDPSFFDVHRMMMRYASAAILEWLRRGGEISSDV